MFNVCATNVSLIKLICSSIFYKQLRCLDLETFIIEVFSRLFYRVRLSTEPGGLDGQRLPSAAEEQKQNIGHWCRCFMSVCSSAKKKPPSDPTKSLIQNWQTEFTQPKQPAAALVGGDKLMGLRLPSLSSIKGIYRKGLLLCWMKNAEIFNSS